MAKNKTVTFFFYGTLCVPSQLSSVTGCTFNQSHFKQATLHGYTKKAVRNAHFPAIHKDRVQSAVSGYVVDVPEKAVKNLDMYEGVPSLYTRETVSVTLFSVDASVRPKEFKKVDAQVYVWANSIDRLGSTTSLY